MIVRNVSDIRAAGKNKALLEITPVAQHVGIMKKPTAAGAICIYFYYLYYIYCRSHQHNDIPLQSRILWQCWRLFTSDLHAVSRSRQYLHEQRADDRGPRHQYSGKQRHRQHMQAVCGNLL
jgi:hypothetical protein